jgi:hypothetical protein
VKAHRHTTGGHEHEYEPSYGLPELLPAGEHVLWQGSPDWRMLARRAFHVRKLAVYFGLLVALRLAFLIKDQAGAMDMVRGVSWMLVLGGIAIGLMTLMGWLSARAAVYTITDKRVVMRIGIVLTLTFNVPFKCMAGAGLRLDEGGTGDLPLTLAGQDRIAWLHLWPHARPWRLARPEPMLRSVPQAAEVARVLTQAWSASTGQAAVAESQDAQAGRGIAGHHAGAGQPALAGH